MRVGGVSASEKQGQAMTPKISLAYITNRAEPKFEWFVESLYAQTTPEQRADIKLVVIDARAWRDGNFAMGGDSNSVQLSNPWNLNVQRRESFLRAVSDRFEFLHIPPLPCAWQGPFRQTSKDFFCAGNSRNTLAVVAGNPYLVFADDLSVVMPGWYNQVLHAATDGYIACGMYKKVRCLNVAQGIIVSYEEFPGGIDSRWNRGSDGGVVPWHGAGLFGCSFGVPLEAMLEVDGNDRACDGAGAEDYDLGIRLERAGYAFYLNRNMLTLESEELHHGGSKLPQERKFVTPENRPADYDTYTVPNFEERYMSDHVLLNRVCNETDRILPLIGSDLRKMREHYMATGLVPVPAPGQRDWRDGTLLSEY